jgi:formylglycine-generating enzyme required for sulfatase activity
MWLAVLALGCRHDPCPPGAVAIPEGTFRMGTDDQYPEERSAGPVHVAAFCLAAYEVTNAAFGRFVAATGYVTVAERPLPEDEFPGLPPSARAPGALVFVPVPEGRAVADLGWWRWVPGADWRHPGGPDTTLNGLDAHPVVQVAYDDAAAYARWVGGTLPTEAQWELAARGGLAHATYEWGDTWAGRRANTWQGRFPWTNTEEDGFFGTAPVGSFPPNGYGLYDMTGNVWEWTADPYRPRHGEPTAAPGPADLPGRAAHVLKGGSFLCSPDYCGRYRPSARQPEDADSGMAHIGFRVAWPPG